MNVYFIPGLGANCKVFKYIELPEGYEKKYIEWITPEENDSLLDYANKMAQNIDTSSPFILVGYSFGGIIVQEINTFLNPEKTIILSSIKNKNEIPNYFKLVRKTRFLNYFPTRFLSGKGLNYYKVIRKLYLKNNGENMEEYISSECINPIYLKWSMKKVTEWIPSQECPNLFHIHGTKDIVFPVRNIKNSFLIENTDHLMVLQKPKKVNKIISDILENYSDK